jgi:hypothetical protein
MLDLMRLALKIVPRNTDARCKAQTKSGNPCCAAATAGGLCFFHANPNKAAELGRIGGRGRRTNGVEGADPLPTLGSAQAVRDTVSRLIADVYTGKLNPRIAAGLAPLVHLQLRAIRMADVEELQRRVAKVEKLLAEKARDSKDRRSP